MNYFIIHAGNDYEAVKHLIELWSSESKYAKFSVLKSTKTDWYDDAHAKIRSAHKIIYVVGETSGKNKNIDWELETAVAENKEIYVYPLDSTYALNQILKKTIEAPHVESGSIDGEIVYSQRNSKIILLADEQIKNKFTEDDRYLADRLIASQNDNLDVALKQYEMFVETSEELVRRKQNVNSFYITINSLIVSIIMATFALSNKITLLDISISVSSVVVCISALLGIIVCSSWHSLLQSYADLNSSKMKIISYIESHLAYNLYDTEWELLSNKIGNKKYKSFSKKEKLIAKLFLGLYAALFITGICLSFI